MSRQLLASLPWYRFRPSPSGRINRTYRARARLAELILHSRPAGHFTADEDNFDSRWPEGKCGEKK